MGFIRNLFDRLAGRDDFFEEDEMLWDEEYFWKEDRAGIQETDEEESQEAAGVDTEEGAEDGWDWDSLTNERTFLKMSDPYQREKYIRSLVEQVKNASGELDGTV